VKPIPLAANRFPRCYRGGSAGEELLVGIDVGTTLCKAAVVRATERRVWWEEARAWAEAPPRLLAELVQAGAPAGQAGRGRLPRLAGATLTVAGHDHLSASVGAGARGAALLAGIAARRYGGIDQLPGPARAAPERSLR
jgi:sugar (pentulose or hexulose) kinase